MEWNSAVEELWKSKHFSILFSLCKKRPTAQKPEQQTNQENPTQNPKKPKTKPQNNQKINTRKRTEKNGNNIPAKAASRQAEK